MLNACNKNFPHKVFFCFFLFSVYCSENRLKINSTSYGENFYYLTYQDKQI